MCYVVYYKLIRKYYYLPSLFVSYIWSKYRQLFLSYMLVTERQGDYILCELISLGSVELQDLSPAFDGQW